MLSKLKRRQTVLAGAVAAFVALSVIAHTVHTFPIDLTILRAVQSLNYGPLEAMMRFLTWLGFWPQVAVLSVLASLAVYRLRGRWESVMVLGSVSGGWLAANAIKWVVNRPRPEATVADVAAQLPDSSYPSGHVVYYVSLCGFLSYLCFVHVKPGPRRTLALSLLAAIVALAGLSRIYLGEHWPSDVLGGYLLGGVWLVLAIAVYRWGQSRFQVR